MALSNRTITFLAEVFYGGTGPTHREIQFIWDLNGAGAYLPPEEAATKRDRVLYGLRHLRDGRAGDGAQAGLAQDEDKLHVVAGELAAKIIEDDPEQNRKVISVEMEALGFGAACTRRAIPFIVVKSVTDFADETKNDDFHSYCCRAAADLVGELIGDGIL